MKKQNSFGVNDFYYHYRTYRKGIINKPLYRLIIKDFFKELVNYIYKGILIDLPNGLGGFYIQKYKQKISIDKNDNAYHKGYSVVDWKNTNLLWKDNPELRGKTYLFYENKHTDGYKFKLSKIKFKKAFLNKIYNFVPSITFKRDLAKIIFNDPYRDFLTT